MLGPTAERLLGRAAESAVRRIRHDRGSVPVQLHHLLAYLEEHLFEPGLSVRRLFSACQLPPSAAGTFRRAIGTTPGDYIEVLRLETATHLLTGSDLPIWQVAELVGYTSTRVFRRAYRRRLGRRPGALRQTDSPTACHGPGAIRISRPFELRVIEQVHAEATWKQLASRDLDEQQTLLTRYPDLATPSLFWLLCEQGLEQGRREPNQRQSLSRLALTCAEILEPDAQDGGSPLRAAGLAFLSNSYRLMPKLPAARKTLKEAERLLPPPGLAPTEAGTVAAFKASLTWQERRMTKAHETATQASDLLRRGTQPQILIRTLLLQLVLAYHLCLDQELPSLFDEAQALLSEHDHPFNRLTYLQYLAIYQVDRGLLGAAETSLGTAKDLCQKIEGGKVRQAYLQWTEGRLWLGRQQLQIAAETIEQVRTIFQSLQLQQDLTLINLDLACIYCEMGHSKKVIRLTHEALRLAEALEWRPEQLVAFNLLSRAARDQELSRSVLGKARRQLR